MERGRLIRVGKYRGDPNAVSYIVALLDSAAAIDLIRKEAAGPDDEIVDLGRVSGDLLKALNLLQGDFTRVDDPRNFGRFDDGAAN
jgi:hypothetical protein